MIPAKDANKVHALLILTYIVGTLVLISRAVFG